MNVRFHDRCEAGRLLARRLSLHAGQQDVSVVALTRGGVPVACEVARELAAPLDILVTHKLGVPHHPGCLLGAIASGGGRFIDEAVVRELRVPQDAIEHAVDHALTELTRREHTYRGALFGPWLHGRTIVLVDDGIATGATIRAALHATRRQEAARVVVAVPVAPAAVCGTMRREAEEVVCLLSPDPFVSIDACYRHFPQVTDDEARRQFAQFAHEGGRTTVAAGPEMA